MLKPNKSVKVKRGLPTAKLIVFSDSSEQYSSALSQILQIIKIAGASYSGPVFQKNKRLTVNVRKSPDGDGSGSIAYFKKTIRKCIIYVYNERIILNLINNLSTHNDVEIQIKYLNVNIAN